MAFRRPQLNPYFLTVRVRLLHQTATTWQAFCGFGGPSSCPAANCSCEMPLPHRSPIPGLLSRPGSCRMRGFGLAPWGFITPSAFTLLLTSCIIIIVYRSLLTVWHAWLPKPDMRVEMDATGRFLQVTLHRATLHRLEGLNCTGSWKVKAKLGSKQEQPSRCYQLDKRSLSDYIRIADMPPPPPAPRCG